LTLALLVVVYWWNVTSTCEWSNRIMSVTDGLSLLIENMTISPCRSTLIVVIQAVIVSRKIAQHAVGRRAYGQLPMM
jgi:hypothetical protein